MYRENILSVIDEIKTLGGQQDRSGSTLGSILRSAWSASDISNHAADPTRRRSISAHTYRYCMVAGVQYDTADVLMRDDGAGTRNDSCGYPQPTQPPSSTTQNRTPAGHYHDGNRLFVTGSRFEIGYPAGVRDLVRAAKPPGSRQKHRQRPRQPSRTHAARANETGRRVSDPARLHKRL